MTRRVVITTSFDRGQFDLILLAAVSFAGGLNDIPRLWLAALFVLIGGLHLVRLWRWHDRWSMNTFYKANCA